MEVVKQIKKEELESIRESHKELNNIISEIGILESQKHAKLHALAEVNAKLEDIKKTLEKEYGSININLEDGSYTLIED
jgi:hypothetical protein